MIPAWEPLSTRACQCLKTQEWFRPPGSREARQAAALTGTMRGEAGLPRRVTPNVCFRTYEKAVSGGGEREKGGHVLRDTTNRGLYVRVWPPHTSERRGGGGGCEQEGWQGGEGRARMSGQEERQRHIRRC